MLSRRRSRVGDMGIRLGHQFNAPIRFVDDSRRHFGAIFVLTKKIDDFPRRYACD
jgi:hypothetical protein